MDLAIVYHPDYVAPLPEQHRFPMQKFRLLKDLLLADGVITPQQIFTPQLPDLAQIELVHNSSYVQGYCEGTLEYRVQRRIGLPWSKPLANRTQIAIGGTILTAQLAIEYGFACNTAGGTHHAFPDYGSGFCIFNDLAIAAKVLLETRAVKQILIIDCDVHQGDGTAFIFQNEPRVFTFSMHCSINFPNKKQQSDLDIALPESLDDEGYLQILATHLDDLLTGVNPDLVLYDAGVDVHICDRLGKLALSDRGIYRRDRMILSACATQKCPVACVIGGGYSNNMQELVYRHSLLHRAAKDVVS